MSAISAESPSLSTLFPCLSLFTDLNKYYFTNFVPSFIAPVLHESIARQGKTPVLGPLWVSAGEPCRPLGPYLFLTKVLKPRIVNRLKKDKEFRKEVIYDDEW